MKKRLLVCLLLLSMAVPFSIAEEITDVIVEAAENEPETIEESIPDAEIAENEPEAAMKDTAVDEPAEVSFDIADAVLEENEPAVGYTKASTKILRLPSKLKKIEAQAFQDNKSMKVVRVANGTESIGSKAFADTGLTDIYLPSSVTYIADDAFDGIKNLVIHATRRTYAYEYAQIKGITTDANDLYNVGDMIYFGTYDQDGRTSNGAEPIEWRILDYYGDGSYLLLSEYGLDQTTYDINKRNITWENCTLRSWLNGSFLSTAFTEEERSKMITVTNQNSDNSVYGVKGGNATQDTVWLLSIDEAYQYFSNDAARVCYPTQTAKKDGAGTLYKDTCWWLLRSPGYHSNYSAYVNYAGSVNAYGCYVYHAYDCVRPVVVVQLS